MRDRARVQHLSGLMRRAAGRRARSDGNRWALQSETRKIQTVKEGASMTDKKEQRIQGGVTRIHAARQAMRETVRTLYGHDTDLGFARSDVTQMRTGRGPWGPNGMGADLDDVEKEGWA